LFFRLLIIENGNGNGIDSGNGNEGGETYAFVTDDDPITSTSSNSKKAVTDDMAGLSFYKSTLIRF